MEENNKQGNNRHSNEYADYKRKDVILALFLFG